MILIFPPVSKPGEPPGGIAKLAGVLKGENLPCTIIDANIEGLSFLLKKKYTWADTWYKRAARKTEGHISSLQSPEGYLNINTYKQAVKDVNRVLSASTFTHQHNKKGITITLTDYQHLDLSPAQSSDILMAAESPEENPFYPYFAPRFTTIVEKTGDAIIGFSLIYLSQVLTTFAMIGFLKKRFPSLTIIIGGGLVTTWQKNPAWQNPFSGLVDECTAGPGEKKVLSLYNKEPKADVRYTPSFSLFPLDSYLSPSYVLPYASSIGCYWKKCGFCPEKAENNSYIPLNPADALKDISLMCEQKKPSLLHLLDNALSLPLLTAISRQPPGVPWYGYARISEQLADPDFTTALKKSGCVMLKIGLESGDESVLEKMEKGFSLDLASRVLKSLKKADIATYVHILFGTPWENEASARHTIDFIRQHHDFITFLSSALFNMPLCDTANLHYQSTHFYQGDLSLYTDFIHPLGWGRKEVRRFLKYEFNKNRIIADILKRNPPFFNANHAPFFIMADGK
ncbi:MAG: hypothetical protein JXJ04_23030 [Spirochaetales bacterium]|nr:hypothetical protein [Spirochaetales bacterium]